MTEPKFPRNSELVSKEGQVGQPLVRFMDQVKKRAYDYATTFKNIINLTEIVSADAANDYLVIYDADEAVAKRINPEDLAALGSSAIVASVEYTSSSTWTKAANPAVDSATARVIIECWGSGGGGGRGNQSAGGGGGAYSQDEWAYADLPASLDVTVGAGGAGSTSNGVNGSNGNASTVTETGGSTVYCQAFGGGGGEGNGSAGATVLGGGGGGLLGAGQNGGSGGNGGALGGGANTSEGNITPPTAKGGGGAGNVGDGGDAYSGGGGGGGTTSGTPSSGGTSVTAGAGGGSSAGTGFATGEDGTAPSGGGGAGYNANGGDGARGQVRITIIG